jgi:thiol:disulfide interchange protein DsbD
VIDMNPIYRRAGVFLGLLGSLLASRMALAAPSTDQEWAEKTSETGKLVSLHASFLPADPFAPENQAGWKARRGQVVTLHITGTLQPGYVTYPITQRAPKQPRAMLSQIRLDAAAGLQPLWPVRESDPHRIAEGNLGTFLKYKGKFTWDQDVLVLPEATPGPHTLPVRVHLQVCRGQCVWGTHVLEATLPVSDEAPLPLTPEVQARREAKQPEPKLVPVSGEEDVEGSRAGLAKGTLPKAGSGAAGEPESAGLSLPDEPEDYASDMSEIQDQLKGQAGVSGGVSSWAGFFGFILQGIFWGGVSLFTPCVFPMIPITVSFFLKQGEKEHHRPLLLASVYSLTIVVVLTVAAVALLSFFRWLSVHPLMNVALGVLFIYFALSLFGMYDIQLPSFLARWTSAGEARGGLVGTMFMALTFTIISFACVAPYLGGFGGTTAGASVSFLARLLGGLAFAATFASPFFVLALFPGLLKRMPQSGGWLNTVKVVMGFLELAAALKFFRAGELILLPRPTFFTFDLVLGMWIALSLLCGLYLLGVFRLPHDSPQSSIGVPRLLFGFLFLTLSFYLSPGLLKLNHEGENQRPRGSLYAWIDSFLLPEPAQGTGELAWTGNLKAAIDEARRQKKRVFVDFTGETCTNCKLNEMNVFSKPDIRKLFQSYLLVQLYTDKVPDKFYSTAARRQFGGGVTRQRDDATRINLPFQRAAFDSEQLPLYVKLEPLPDGTIRVVGTYKEGKINDEAAFAEFLKEPAAPGGERLALGGE